MSAAPAGVAEAILERFRTDDCHLFVHAPTTIEHEAYHVSQGETLPNAAERALLIARPKDWVCVPGEVDPRYLNYLASLGFSARVLPVDAVEADEALALRARRAFAPGRAYTQELAAALGRTGRVVVDPYLCGKDECALARAFEAVFPGRSALYAPPLDLCRRANSKRWMREFAKSAGASLARGWVHDLGPPAPERSWETLHALCVRALHDFSSLILRLDHSASGSGTFLVERIDDPFRQTLCQIAADRQNRFVLVEERLAIVSSPNLMFHVGSPPEVPRCVGVSEQQLDDQLAYCGSVAPARSPRLEEMITVSQRIAARLQGQGYRGPLGVDWLEADSGPGRATKAIFVEVNARVNAASYAHAALARLAQNQRKTARPVPSAFNFRIWQSRVRGYDEMLEQARPLFFEPDRGAGILPVAPGRLAGGIVSAIALAPDREEATRRMDEFAATLDPSA